MVCSSRCCVTAVGAFAPRWSTPPRIGCVKERRFQSSWTGIADVYDDGYGELAMALHAAGWRDDGGGILDPVVDALHAARKGDRRSPTPA